MSVSYFCFNFPPTVGHIHRAENSSLRNRLRTCRVILYIVMTGADQSQTTDTNDVSSVATKKDEALRQMKEHYVNVLMNQTTWNEEEAREKLEETGYNIQSCVRMFMGMPAEKAGGDASSRTKTVNQEIYGNIRTMMDEASSRYEKRKALEEKLEAYKQMMAQRRADA